MDSEGVPALVVTDTAPTVAPRVRWWRRRPPARMTSLARGVWWTGHAQLFISVAVLILGPLSLLTARLLATGEVAGWIGACGWLATAMALPFAMSGAMLRAYGSAMNGVTRRLVWQIAELALVIAGIAVLAIALTFLIALVLLFTVMAALAQR